MRKPLYLHFEDLKQPICLIGCKHLTEYFSILFPEWPYRFGKHDDNPVISIKFEQGVYHLSTSWTDEVKRYSDKVDVLCSLMAKLAKASSFSDLDTLYLHAASVVINGRLVVFPSQYRAGKSFLTVCLAAAGFQYFGDDVVPLTLDDCKGRSLGFAPRLRIPIPTTTDIQSKHFIEANTALLGKRYAYLAIDEKSRVVRNGLLDIGGFVLLNRQEGIRPQLEELPAATVFKQLIKQNFAREIDGVRILATLSQAISQAKCIKIHYDRADDAIKLLEEYFSSWSDKSTNAVQLSPNASEIESKARESISKDNFIQHSGAQKVRIEGESFLTSPDGKAIYHLNLVGSGIWELLAEPTSTDVVVSTLAIAFPQIERMTIEKDVSKIFKSFRLKNLICRATV